MSLTGLVSTVWQFCSNNTQGVLTSMQKLFIMLIFLYSYLGASTITYPGLFATVVNVAENDTLNVRESSEYHSKKTGALPQDAFVGINYCKKVGKSTWCKIFHITQRDYEEFGYDAKDGWVNARYLKFDNRGYVIIDGKPKCDYALRCKDSKCEVVIDYMTNPNTNNITSLKTQWIKRDQLKASSNFGAVGDARDGYCTKGTYIEDFLKTQKEKKILLTVSNPLRKKVLEIVSLLNGVRYGGIDEFMEYMHPQKGIVMTGNVYFGGKEDLTFTHSDIKNLEKNRFKKIHWGYTYGKGDEVRMSLYDYMSKLTKHFNDISKIEKLKTLKRFHCPSGMECKGYEVFWINEKSETKEYDWQGLVLIFEKYRGKWYVVGLMRDRWTI